MEVGHVAMSYATPLFVPFDTSIGSDLKDVQSYLGGSSPLCSASIWGAECYFLTCLPQSRSYHLHVEGVKDGLTG